MSMSVTRTHPSNPPSLTPPSTFTQPLDYPSALLTKRVRLPSQLHLVVDDSCINGSNITATREFSHTALTKAHIDAHMQPSAAKSSFISAYESEEIALYSPTCRSSKKGKARAEQEVKVTLSMSGLVPAWMANANGVHIPVWVGEKGRSRAGGGDVWICLEEVGVVLGCGGEKGEWLVCGGFPRKRIRAQCKLQWSFDHGDEEKEDEEKRDAHRLKEKKSQRAIQCPPRVPVRSSSLKTVSLKASRGVEEQLPKLRLRTRDATLELTNADEKRASSLFKYALLMAHGKKLLAEETWQEETMSLSKGSVNSECSEESSGGKEKSREANPYTVSNSRSEEPRSHWTPSPSSRTSSRHEIRFQRRSSTSFELGLGERREAHGDRQDTPPLVDIQDLSLRRRRSIAPSPSESLYSPNIQDTSEKTRRPRREMLLELQSDVDSTLREYARISLQDADNLAEAKRQSKQEDILRHKTEKISYHRPSSPTVSEDADIDIWLPSDASPSPSPPPSRSAALLAQQKARQATSATLEARLESLKSRQKPTATAASNKSPWHK